MQVFKKEAGLQAGITRAVRGVLSLR